MAVFSLITVTGSNGEEVEGAWIQNHIGTLESASKLAREYESHGKPHSIQVAVVPQIPSSTPALGYWTNLKRLDTPIAPHRRSDRGFER